MKRMKLVVIIIGVFLLIGGGYYISLPDWKIHQSYSFSNSGMGTRETELEVAVFKFWGYDDMIKEIEREHMEVNDYMDTELTIKLYHWKTRGNEPFRTEVFEY